MLISCTSCKSKYLVNSADLKPDGRIVQCAKCGNQWHQDHFLNAEDQIDQDISIDSSLIDTKKNKNDLKSLTRNLPATYVKEQKVSILNSILVILFVFIFISLIWIIRDLEINSLVLLKFYLDEFAFNLQLIFDDVAKIIHKLIN